MKMYIQMSRAGYQGALAKTPAACEINNIAAQFHLLHWKQNTDDEDEFVLGTVHLTNGRDFLITTVTDPEGQWFRVYGIRQGKLAMVYSGGGSSC